AGGRAPSRSARARGPSATRRSGRGRRASDGCRLRGGRDRGRAESVACDSCTTARWSLPRACLHEGGYRPLSMLATSKTPSGTSVSYGTSRSLYVVCVAYGTVATAFLHRGRALPVTLVMAERHPVE